MTITSRLIGRAFALPPAEHDKVAVDRDLPVEMRDGTVLLADRYTPCDASGSRAEAPTVLVRSPYGRRGVWGAMYGHLLAERGFIVVVQSVRGTFGSGGTFVPYAERDDGLDTVAWIERQPWFTGVLGTAGVSYLGITQWALAAGAGPSLKACTLVATASQFVDRTYPGGGFSLLTAATWMNLISRQERLAGTLRGALAARRIEAALGSLPLSELDQRTTGHAVGFWQDWLDHPSADDPFWAPRRFDGTVGEVTAEMSLVAGWYDIFLPWQLKDYAALRAAGRSPRLTIGPWWHSHRAMSAAGLRETLAHLRTHLGVGERPDARPSNPEAAEAPVRVYVTGENRWRDLPDWPPPAATAVRWYLAGGNPAGGNPAGGGLAKREGRLSTDYPEPSAPDRYRYDPADPTPGLSGPQLAGNGSEPTDNRRLESRPDVLTFTSAQLTADTDVIGPVSAELHVSASAGHADFFVRLCDVHPDGRSLNVCDGMIRVRPGSPAAADDGTVAIGVEMWPVAHRFARGHRLRVQVSSGAHPRFARNPGSDEPLGTATTLVPSEQAVYHDPHHRSAVLLPIVPPPA